MHGHAAGVIAPVFEPLKALNEDGNDVAGRNGADDATHGDAPDEVFFSNCGDVRLCLVKFHINYNG
jgi:hypothetical protein